MRVGIIGGSIAGCATAALLHRAGHDVTVFERSESGLVSRGAGILMVTTSWQDMTARGLVDGTGAPALGPVPGGAAVWHLGLRCNALVEYRFSGATVRVRLLREA